MKKIVLILVALAFSVFAQLPTDSLYDAPKFIHVSTIPTGADIYVNKTVLDYSKTPDYVTPAFIPIELTDQEGVVISLFKPGFVDTTLRIRPSSKDTSYQIVPLKELYDDDLLQGQENAMSKRNHYVWGRYMKFASIVPFAIGGVAGIVSAYYIGKANDAKKAVEETTISSGSWKGARDDFHDYKKIAERSKYTAVGGIVLGASLLTVGFILSF
ncbi:MAG: hypothetical protein HUK20_04240 [Fibrobacter sp.]|nr:hypothetical protein [Fibrobacter sp.]